MDCGRCCDHERAFAHLVEEKQDWRFSKDRSIWARGRDGGETGTGPRTRGYEGGARGRRGQVDD